VQEEEGEGGDENDPAGHLTLEQAADPEPRHAQA
jgi:hypothetical protein